MWRLESGLSVVLLFVLTALLWVMPAPVAEAQGLSGISSSVDSVLGRSWGALSRIAGMDRPGAADPSMPVIFPAYFGGEFHVRPAFFNVTKAQVISSRGSVIDVKSGDSRNGAELSDTGSYIENMLRFQFGRLSLRGYYNVDLNRLNSSYVSVNWLTWRLGADLDVIDWNGLRIGAAYDFYPERPFVTVNLTKPDGNRLSAKICANPPQTLGLVASYTPCLSCSISPSVEFRYQWPLGQCCSDCSDTSSLVTQWEIAAGFVLPRTALGRSGVRFGYRETNLCSGCSSLVDGERWAIDLSTSAYFGELVWFY